MVLVLLIGQNKTNIFIFVSSCLHHLKSLRKNFMITSKQCGISMDSSLPRRRERRAAKKVAKRRSDELLTH
jgi:5-methylcytosine-specific restriction endonuclease McrA